MSQLFGSDRADRRGRGSRRSGVQTAIVATGRPSVLTTTVHVAYVNTEQNKRESDVLDHNTVTTNRVQTSVHNAIFHASV